jgi:hypothetical protein
MRTKIIDLLARVLRLSVKTDGVPLGVMPKAARSVRRLISNHVIGFKLLIVPQRGMEREHA